LKKAYNKACLRDHPDKGGDPAAFRDMFAAWSTLRDMFKKGRVASFAAIWTSTKVCVCVCVCVCMCMCVCVCVCECVRMCVCTCMYLFIHIYIL
jgi:hypothetical protein